jgi:hypothetical protein
MNLQLRIINGGLQKSLLFKGIKLIATPGKFLPTNIDALVFEEDAFLIMSDEPEHIPLLKNPIRLTQVRQLFFKYIVISIIYRILTLFFLTTFFIF